MTGLAALPSMQTHDRRLVLVVEGDPANPATLERGL